jgi:3-oxoacyl-[acyl-carrier-protein] synthase II
MKRVVVTGIGVVSPLGCGNGKTIWSELIKGKNGIKKLPELYLGEKTSLTVRMAGIVPRGKGPLEFDDTEFKSIERETSLFIRYAIKAAHYAIEDANLLSSIGSDYDPSRCGVSIGNGGIGSLQEIITAHVASQESVKKISPYFVPKILTNMASGHVSILYGFQGPVHAVSTACAAGTHSIGDAFNMIRLGYADLMLAGGSDASLDPLAIIGFARMKALSGSSTAFTDPLKSSRPFDAARNGFVMGEGAGVIVLESLESAQRRQAPIIVEVLGYGMSGDAHHATSPSSEGSGALRSMEMAIRNAGLSADQVGYINCHATSTPVGDAVEIRAIKQLLRNCNAAHESNYPHYVSSTKGSMGHLLGAAGAVETAMTAMAVLTDIIPPTLHLDNVDPACESEGLFHHVPHQSIDYRTGQPWQADETEHRMKGNTNSLNYALKNSFGFGGTNATLLLGKYLK